MMPEKQGPISLIAGAEGNKQVQLRPAPWLPSSWAVPREQYRWPPGQRRWLLGGPHSDPAAAGSPAVPLAKKKRHARAELQLCLSGTPPPICLLSTQ